MKKDIKFLKKTKDGMAYIYVIFAFIMIAIFLTCMLGLFQSNLNQAKNHERQIQAYYLSLSGVDIATAALLQPGDGADTRNLLNIRFSEEAMPFLDTSFALTDTLTLTDGTADVNVSAFLKDGDRWIRVCSIGTLSGSGVSKTLVMTFPISNPDQRVWEQK